VPELVEVEIYRRMAERVVGRVIESVDAPDAWFCKRSTTPERLGSELPGATVLGTHRRGKLLLLDLARPASDLAPDLTLGLRFGMTGRLLVDGRADIGELLYSSSRDEATWDRFALTFVGGGSLSIRDPRRLGGVEIDPESAPTFSLGPDAARITAAELRRSLATARGPIKAALLDQTRIAGVGNLIADEVLWRSGISPKRVVPSLDDVAMASLAASVRRTIALLQKRGGSHLGDHVGQRNPDGVCPRDGAPLLRTVVGGRTTYECPVHQH
jgi:formamidopyrimidine-DNA glycosylase